MIRKKKRLLLSKHAIERFDERVSRDFGHLANECSYSKLRNLILNGRETKAFLNDTKMLLKMQDKYGGINFRFVVNGNAIFVIKVLDDIEMLVTVLTANMRPRLKTRHKFKKKDTEVLDMYAPDVIIHNAHYRSRAHKRSR